MAKRRDSEATSGERWWSVAIPNALTPPQLVLAATQEAALAQYCRANGILGHQQPAAITVTDFAADEQPGPPDGAV